MSEHTYEIARQCASKFTSPTASEIAQEIATRVYISSDAVVQQIAADVACRLLQSGLDTAITNAVNPELIAQLAAKDKQIAALKAELADWNNAAKHVEAEHTDEIHCGCVPVLRKKNTELKAELTRLCGLVERAKTAVTALKNMCSCCDDAHEQAAAWEQWLKDAGEVTT